jgi:hypothetical protein
VEVVARVVPKVEEEVDNTRRTAEEAGSTAAEVEQDTVDTGSTPPAAVAALAPAPSGLDAQTFEACPQQEPEEQYSAEAVVAVHRHSAQP